MKKVVNSVLASALALTVAPMVVGAEEAAPTATQMDPGLEKVVKRLEALKLIQGYGNGDYGVERSITRAEFATLVVRAKGLEEGAKLAQFQSNFTDVKPADWFAGYVNVASGQEIVKGYQDQSFRAGNNVTYAEAVAMIIRSLGYDPAVKGVWPNNYIAKASELGISKGVKVSPDKAATRGDVMMMLDNALTVGLMKQTEYGTDIRFEIYDGKNNYEKKTLLTEYLDVDVYDTYWANTGGNKNRELPYVANTPVTGLGTLKSNQIQFSGGLKGTYKLADGLNVNGYSGQHVQVWVKNDREDYVVWMEDSDDEEVLNVRTDTIYLKNKVQADGKNIKSDDEISDLEFKFDNDKTYSFAKKGLKVTYNFKTYDKAWEGLKDIANINADVAASAKIVLNDDGDIAYINVLDDATAGRSQSGVKYGSQVIKKIDANKLKIENLEATSFNEMKDKEEGKQFLVYINGELAKFADLQPMDVYNVYYPQGKKDRFVILASRTVVEGKVDKVDARKNNDNRLVIGDKTYRVRSGASYSDNKGKDIKTPTADDLRDKVRDLDGVDVKLYLDATGRIRHIETKENVNDRRYKAIITKDASYNSAKDSYDFVVYNEKGAKQTISVESKDIEWGYNDPKGKFKAGDELKDTEVEATLLTIDAKKSADSLRLLEITLNSKGDVNKVKVLDTSDLLVNQLSGKDWDVAADEDGNVLNVKDKNGKKTTYEVTDSTVLFDMTGDIEGRRHELKDVALAKFKSVAKDDDKTVYYLTNDGDLEYAFVVLGSSVGSANEYGMIKTFSRKGGDDTVDIIKKDGDEVKVVTYKLDGDVKDAQKRFNRFDFVSFSLNSDDEVIINKVQAITEGYNKGDVPGSVKVNPDMKKAKLDDLTTGIVTKVDGRKITIKHSVDKNDKDRDTYVTSSSTVYLSTSDLDSMGGISEDDYVVLVETDDDDTLIDYVIKVTDQDEIDENYEDGESDYDMTKFLTGKDKPEPGNKDLVDISKATVNVETSSIGAKRYQVVGAKGTINTEKVDKVVVTLGTKAVEVTVNADGSFETGKYSMFDDLKTYTITVTDNDGNKTTVTGNVK